MASRLAVLRRLHPPLITVALIAAVLSTSWRTGVFHAELPLLTAFRYGFSGRGLLLGHWSTTATSQFLTRDGFMAVSICASLALMLGSYELLAGSRRAALVVGVCGAAGPLVVGGCLGLGSAFGLPFAGRILSTLDYGASAITAGGGGAFVGLVRRRWLTRLALAFVLSGLVLHHQMADWEHLVSFPIGYGLGRWLGRPTVRAFHPARSRRLRLTGVFTAIGLIGSGVVGVAVASAAVEASPQTPVATIVAGNHPATLPTPPAQDNPLAPGLGSSPGLPPTPLSPATLIDVHYPTPSLGGDRRALILLPAGYREHPNVQYPVVELLHGDPGGPEDVMTGLNLGDVAAHAGLGPFIAVAPDGHGPAEDVGDWADTTRQHLGAAVSDDLRRWVDSSLRSDGRWGVMGYSSGGYGAAYLGMRSPAMYGAVCVMSGFFVARSPAFAHESANARAAASPVLHASPDGPRTLLFVGGGDAENVNNAKHYLQALQTVGQSGNLQILPGTHDWPVWRAATPECLRFLLAAPRTHKSGL